jgi:hypothetical protein
LLTHCCCCCCWCFEEENNGWFCVRFQRDVIGAEMFSELIRKGGDRRYFIATRPNMRNARPLICKQSLSAPVGSEVKNTKTERGWKKRSDLWKKIEVMGG